MMQHQEENSGGVFSSSCCLGDKVDDENDKDGGTDESGGGERSVGEGGDKCAGTEQGEQPKRWRHYERQGADRIAQRTR